MCGVCCLFLTWEITFLFLAHLLLPLAATASADGNSNNGTKCFLQTKNSSVHNIKL